MPGRTRPLFQESAATAMLQWRAGQLPGRTTPRWSHPRGGTKPASMEGRAIARPNLITTYRYGPNERGFNGGPGNCPAEPENVVAITHIGIAELQWRAGQLPGRTLAAFRMSSLVRCFNGGPGNCPAEPVAAHHRADGCHRASMEGRAIARPNALIAAEQGTPIEPLQWRAGQLPGRTISKCSPRVPSSCFNGGPGNCPAEPDASERSEDYLLALQWRAGQLPGRTCNQRCSRGRVPTASMEGRAIARPNAMFSASSRNATTSLQWRAGQLPGRTPSVGWAIRQRILASMEGRAIARPNCSSDLVGLTCPFTGDCERSCKHALRRCWYSVFKLHFVCSCKASSGP